MSILDYQPKDMQARSWQTPVAREIEKYWKGADVFVIPGKVGFGKSFIAMLIAHWRAAQGETVATLTPRISLQKQYTKSFPYIPVLMGKDRYNCKKEQSTCGTVYELSGAYCKNCCYQKLKKKIMVSNEAIFNYSSYLYMKKHRDVLIVDEAHLLYDFLSEQYTMRLWAHKEDYPDTMVTAGDVAIWLEKRLEKLEGEIAFARTTGSIKEYDRLVKIQTKFGRVYRGLQEAPANFFIEKTTELYMGKPKKLLKIRPENLIGLPDLLWPDYANKKLILMSGSISSVDIRRLGLRGRRIKWINCENPIDASQRPVDASSGLNMSFKYQDANAPGLAVQIEDLAAKNPGKGLIHSTYGLAQKLQPHLTGDRYIWHTPDNREEQLEKFMSSEDGILVACGMSEGLDLSGEDYAWQVVTKIMWPNKGDPLIAKWYRDDIEWILWLTLRTLLQQTGRIVRGPDDYGTTYILDTAFGNIAKKRNGLIQRVWNMVDEDYKKSIIWKENV